MDSMSAHGVTLHGRRAKQSACKGREDMQGTAGRAEGEREEGGGVFRGAATLQVEAGVQRVEAIRVT
eukprot:2228988-Rhodomonas_salina.2